MAYVRPPSVAQDSELFLIYQGPYNVDPATVIVAPSSGRTQLVATYYRPSVGEAGFVDRPFPAEFGDLAVEGVEGRGARAYLNAGESGAVRMAPTRDASQAQTNTGSVSWHYPLGTLLSPNVYVYPSGDVALKLGFGLVEVFERRLAAGGGTGPPPLEPPEPCPQVPRPVFPYDVPGVLAVGKGPPGVVRHARRKRGAPAPGAQLGPGSGSTN